LEPTSSREKRRTIVYLRGLMLVALGGLLLEAGAAQAGTYGLALLAVYALSNISLLLSVPLSVIRSLKFELTVGAVDLLAVGLAVALAGSEGGVLPVSCLILALVLALAHYRTHAVAGTAAVCGLHAWLLLAVSDGSMLAGAVLRLPGRRNPQSPQEGERREAVVQGTADPAGDS